MTLVARIARPFLAGIFIAGGIDQLKAPESKAGSAEAVTGPLSKAVPWLPEDTATLVRINGAVQLGAGSLLAIGRFPRLAALALVGSLVPTTAAGHRFWEQPDAQSTAMHRTQFLKNVSIAGGLLFAATDHGGDPSLVWRAKHAAKDVKRATAAAPTRALKAVS